MKKAGDCRPFSWCGMVRWQQADPRHGVVAARAETPYHRPMDSLTANDTLRDVYTVSRLNREVRALLEGSFPLIWLEAEISNLARPASGHWYFTLKDENAQVRAAMFRNRNRLLRFAPDNGMQVLVRARIGLYEARGEFQLIVEHMEEAGDGALRRAFEALRRRLDAEGLFAMERKRPLPRLPRRIGVVTSPTGAAIRDILTTLRRRFPGIPVVIYPVPVQGDEAAPAIARMLRLAGDRGECDVLILARGGGSLEDLWAFNEEIVARALAACPLPVVTGIGHEVDFTIADFVADQRAPTPTAAAELLTPDQQDLHHRLQQLRDRLTRAMTGRLQGHEQHLHWLRSRLPHPARRIENALQRLDELALRRDQAMNHRLRHERARLSLLQQRLRQQAPLPRIARHRLALDHLQGRLVRAVGAGLKAREARLAALGQTLDAVSPLATLGRGYAIVSRADDGRLVRSHRDVAPGERIEARLGEGRLLATVEETREE